MTSKTRNHKKWNHKTLERFALALTRDPKLERGSEEWLEIQRKWIKKHIEKLQKKLAEKQS